MLKIKVIDLLNMISRGEDVPKTIKKHWVYEWSYDELRDDFCYITKEGKRFDDDWLIIDILEDEIEIIEENKKIEKLKVEYGLNNYKINNHYGEKVDYEIAVKINELIDKINKMENKNG